MNDSLYKTMDLQDKKILVTATIYNNSSVSNQFDCTTLGKEDQPPILGKATAELLAAAAATPPPL